MNRKLKIIAAYFAVLLVGMGAIIGLSGRSPSAKKLSIVATNFPAYDFARAVARDKADIKMLIKPGAEVHDFEPTPQDIIDIRRSQLFIYTGGESDAWVERILRDVNAGKTNDRPRLFRMMEAVGLLKEDEETYAVEATHEHSMHSADDAHDEYDEHDDVHDGHDERGSEHNEHDEYDEYDEHVWTSLRNATQIINSLQNTLADIAPDDRLFFVKNAQNYTDKLTQLDSKFQAIVDKAPRRTLVFGDRFPLRYFAEDYHLKYWAAFPGCSEQTEASGKTVASLIEQINAESIPVVLKIEMTSDNLAQTIAEATGAKVLTFQTAHNVSADDFRNGRTYADIMAENLQVLKEALN